MPAAAPVLSVLMTTWNGGQFLAPAVQSILDQTWTDLELVLVDNASNDGAPEALEALMRDDRLRIFRQASNRGIVGGTNFALAQARGRLIAVVDHDDLALPARFARQIAWLDAHSRHGGVATRTLLVDEAGQVVRPDFTLHTEEEHRVFSHFSVAANFGSHLWRRELVERFPRRGEFPFSSDFDFVARVNEVAPVATLPEVLFHYRLHDRQTTQLRRREQIAAECAIRLLTARRRSGQAENFEAVVAWLARTTAEAGDSAAVYRSCLRECRAQEQPWLAVYHARKLVSVARSPADVFIAAKSAAGAIRRTSNRGELIRLFFRGPLQTYGLHPWP